MNEHTLILADSAKGAVIAIDAYTGASNIVLKDFLLAPIRYSPLGINGRKVLNVELSLINRLQNLFSILIACLAVNDSCNMMFDSFM